MPKRKSERSEEERLRKKIKKYEAKLRKKSARIIHSSDEEIEDEPQLMQDLSAPEYDEHVGILEGAAPVVIQPAAQSQEPVPEAVASPLGPSEPAQQAEIAPAPENPELDPIDPAFLQALGDFIPEAAEWGDDINDNLAKIWEPILRDGLKKESKDEILKKYLLPKNCPLVKLPILNPEIAAVLTESSKNRYLRLLKKQSQLGCILSVLGKIITGMLTKSLDIPGALKLLSDASKLVSDSHFTETETRRALITPMLEKSFIEPFKDRKRDSHLFGDKLGEFIKSSRGIKKTGQLIQAASTSTSTSNLNWRGPPARQFQRNPRTPLNRSGGPPRVFLPPRAPARRRTAAAPAPAAPRPAPAPQALPARRSYTAPTTHRR